MNLKEKKVKIFWFSIIFITAVVVGLLYVGPQLLIKQAVEDNGQVYLPLQVVNDNNDEAICYLPRAREIYDGYFPPVDLYIQENKNLPSLLPYVGETIFSSFIYLTRGDITQARLLSWFILPIILFFIFYYLGLAFLKDKLYSWFFAILATLTPIIITMPLPLISLDKFINIVLKSLFPYIKTAFATLFLGELVNPLATYIIYIPAIINLYLFWQKPSKVRAVISGIFVGLLFYTYFHYWVFISTIILFLFINILLNLKKNKKNIRYFIIFILTILIFFIPYLLNYYSFTQLPHYNELVQRIGVENGRNFRWIVWHDYIFYLVLAVVIYFTLWKKEKKKAIFFWLSLLAMFTCWNLQIVIGYMPHPDHWFRTFSPLLFIMCFNIIYLLINSIVNKTSSDWIKKGTVYAVILLAVFTIFKKAINLFYFIDPPEYYISSNSMPGEIIESWEWIDNNLGKDEVILSPSFISSMYIPLYTKATTYLPTVYNSFSKIYDLEERYLTVNKLFNISRQDLEKFLRADSNYPDNNTHSYRNFVKAPLHLYYDYYREQGFNSTFNKSSRDLPQEKIDELLTRHEEINHGWQDFNSKYIYLGPWEEELASKFNIISDELDLVFNNSLVKIYKINL